MSATSIVSNPTNARTTHPDSPRVPEPRTPILASACHPAAGNPQVLATQRRGSQFDMFIWEIYKENRYRYSIKTGNFLARAAQCQAHFLI